MCNVLCQEAFDANQVAKHPRFECRIADAHKGQLGRVRIDNAAKLDTYIYCQVQDRKDVT